MNNNQDHLADLSQIRSLMERSSRFISLSGLSGVFAGIAALIGAALAFIYINFNNGYFNVSRFLSEEIYFKTIKFLITDGIIVLILAIGSGIYFTTRKARKKGLPIWDNTSKRMIINLLIPLVAGGIFCLILIYHKLLFLIASATLIFYGLALINGSKYTLHEIRYLGISEIFLGLLASVFTGYGLVFWTIGFGVLHIIYGILMYLKHEI